MRKTVKILAKELVNPQPNFLSVVAYPASRETFKIFKSEQGVSKMKLEEFLAQKAQQTQRDNDNPEMVGMLIHDEDGFVEVLKSEHGEVLQAALSECGLELDQDRVQKSESTGDVVLKSESFDPNDAVDVIRITPEVSVIMKGFDPYRAEMAKSTIFAENMATQGACEGIESAFEIGEDTVMAILNDADSPEEAVALIDAAMAQLNTYVRALVAAIPQKAFQMGQVFGGMRHEMSLMEKGESVDTPPDGVDPELWAKMSAKQRKAWLMENSDDSENQEMTQKGFSPHMLPTNPPDGVDAATWKKMTPEARTAWLEKKGLMKESMASKKSETDFEEILNTRLKALEQNVEQIAKHQGTKIVAQPYSNDGYRAKKSDNYDDGSRVIDSAFEPFFVK